MLPQRPVANYLSFQPGGQSVHNGHPDTVQSAGHRVCAGFELSSGVECREDGRQGRLLGLLVLIDRDAASVVLDPDPAVVQKCHVDAVGEAGHGLINGVIDDLPDEVVKTLGAGGTNVHCRTFADRL